MILNEKTKNDLFYLCSLIEYIGRKTSNSRRYVVEKMGEQGIAHELEFADINHCLSFEQVSEELIEQYGIENGSEYQDFRYKVPTVQSIGRVYQKLICDVIEDDNIPGTVKNVFSSYLSDEISYFDSSVYYRNPDYLKWSYLEGKLLA